MRVIIPLIAVLAAACGPRAVTPPREPAPAPRPASTVVAQRPPIPAEVCRCIRICAVRDGRLVEIPVRYNTTTGDTTTMDLLPFSHAAPLTGEYASVAGWYVNGEPIRFRGRRYSTYGRPRILGIMEVAPVGRVDRVTVFAEAGDTASASEFVYLPTRPGCQFQPYQRAGGR